jgi:hypothetical protein
MTVHRRAARLALLTALCTAGCTDGPRTPAAGPPTSSSAATASAAASAYAAPTIVADTQAPAEHSAMPDGVYRSQLTIERAKELGLDDPGMAGTWTLTVKAGTFKLECVATSTPGVECGTHNPALPAVVEVGTLHGTGNTAWFVHDQELLVKLSGCVRHSQKIDGCGPEDAYHLDWKLAGKGLQFNNFVGIGDQAVFPELSNWTVQPWTRIA